MSVMGSRAGGSGRPGTCRGASSIVTSDISMNSRSNIFFTTLADSAAAGLNGPGRVRSVLIADCPAAFLVLPVAASAAAARRARPSWGT